MELLGQVVSKEGSLGWAIYLGGLGGHLVGSQYMVGRCELGRLGILD